MKKVLVIEDDKSIREVLQELFESPEFADVCSAPVVLALAERYCL